MESWDFHAFSAPDRGMVQCFIIGASGSLASSFFVAVCCYVLAITTLLFAIPCLMLEGTINFIHAIHVLCSLPLVMVLNLPFNALSHLPICVLLLLFAEIGVPDNSLLSKLLIVCLCVLSVGVGDVGKFKSIIFLDNLILGKLTQFYSRFD